ncbi:MAG: hypothetical protein M1138_06840 [Candidatus Thermoplasmatota archaeon]|nr:hypothetical protein [Candidatus Thermoplasmatota archaeon]
MTEEFRVEVRKATKSRRKEKPMSQTDYIHSLIAELDSQYSFSANFEMVKAYMDLLETKKEVLDAQAKLRAAEENFEKAVERRRKEAGGDFY